MCTKRRLKGGCEPSQCVEVVSGGRGRKNGAWIGMLVVVLVLYEFVFMYPFSEAACDGDSSIPVPVPFPDPV